MGLEAAGSQQKPVGGVGGGGIIRAIVTTNPIKTCSESMTGIPCRLGGQEVKKAFDRGFFALRGKRGLICCFGQFEAMFRCPVVTLVYFSINLSNFENYYFLNLKSKNPKNFKES